MPPAATIPEHNGRPRTSSKTPIDTISSAPPVRFDPDLDEHIPPPNRSETFESQIFVDAPETPVEQDEVKSHKLQHSQHSAISSIASVPRDGALLTGKQEHYLKRELLSQQSKWEISELSHPTALQRFGAPFRSDAGEVAPEDSELPLLRYIFVHHVRNFPFLNQAKEKEFWQDKLQVFLESFATKHISSSEDRLEETKRAKLAMKAEKLVELMMVSGIPTASGYEERIRFAELEVVDAGPQEQGLVVNMPQGHQINGWDVNVAGVRIISVKRHVRHHKHAEFILRVKRGSEPEIYVGRRFGEFAKMHKRLRLELPGKVLPPLPRKNKSHGTYSGLNDFSDDDSLDSVSIKSPADDKEVGNGEAPGGFRAYLSSWTGATSQRHSRNASRTSFSPSIRDSIDTESITSPLRDSPSREVPPPIEAGAVLPREDQRVSLRAFLRNFLQSEPIASSNAMRDFLTAQPIELTPDEMQDVARRKVMDEKRLEEQRRFYEVARARARELDVHMEKFRRKVIEADGLRDLFSEIRRKDQIKDLDPEYKKFCEWLRIEVAATLYHLFLAEDNSPELFAQAKRIHSLVPYGALKQVIRFTNPAAVMASVLDLFMAQPLGAKSLLQRIFGLALGDGIRTIQKAIDALVAKIDQPIFCQKIKHYIDSDVEMKSLIRLQAKEEQTDLLIKILQTYELNPILESEEVGRAFNAYVAWENAVENVDEEMRQGAEQYSRMKQLLKLHTRQRDKKMMLEMVEESNTLRLFRDLFTIFYEPLVRVYKSANVYNSVTDFARFADDAIATIEKAQRKDIAADPNQTVQSFIDLCERHEDDLYKFIHEVHIHDNGLFDKLMSWIENILFFLRNGPKGGKLDMNALLMGAIEMRQVDKDAVVKEINSLIKWQMARKRWHHDKTRQKMAQGPTTGTGASPSSLASTFKSSDFGLDAQDLQDLDMADDDDDYDSDDDDDDDEDPIVAERNRRKRRQDMLKRTAGEPVKPKIEELGKMSPQFQAMLRMVLAND